MGKQVTKKVKRLVRQVLGLDVWTTPELSFAEARWIGSDYGGWTIAGPLDAKSIVYSFGVGEDLSFDRGLIEAFGCEIHAFDPTPKSLAWVDRQNLPAKLLFHPWGIGPVDGDVRFAAPDNSSYVSYSAVRGKGESVVCPVLRLSSIMARLGHKQIDVLKMDIEGMEYDVLDDIISSEIFPKHILVEFHHGIYDIRLTKTRASLQLLRSAGYKIYSISAGGREYSFIRGEAVAADIQAAYSGERH